MHSWKRMVQLLEMVNRPKTLGYQADMAHNLLFTMGYNAPDDRLLPEGYDWKDRAQLDDAYRLVARALRPWTIDFHVAQNDGTVKGSGSHDKTGRHCLPNDPNGKLDVVRYAGFWLRDDEGHATARGGAHLLGRLYVLQRHDDEAADVGRRAEADDRRAQHARLERAGGRFGVGEQPVAKKKLNIGLVGYGFMGRTHSNAFLQAPRYFDLPVEPVLKAVAARNKDRLETFASNWGYESVETDWRRLVERKDIDLIDIASPNDTHAEIAVAAARAGKMVMCEKPLARTAAEAETMVTAVERAGVANVGLVQLPPGPSHRAAASN